MGSSRSCDEEDGIDRRRVLLLRLLLQGIVIISVACLRWADRRGFTVVIFTDGGCTCLLGVFLVESLQIIFQKPFKKSKNEQRQQPWQVCCLHSLHIARIAVLNAYTS
jgi:hypothetical protein